MNKFTGQFDAIVIGGSAGSLPVLIRILSEFKHTPKIPLILCLHRMRNKSEGMLEVLAKDCLVPVIEPNDKDILLPGYIYLVPANYHLYIESGNSVSLSTELPVHYSRPSIDITFFSAANVFSERVMGILLTGANSDGAEGLEVIKRKGGLTVVQDPKSCTAPFMPESAIKRNIVDRVLKVPEISELIIRTSS